MSKRQRVQTPKKKHEPTASFRGREELRRGSRTDPIPSGTKYDRNNFRNARQNGRYEDA